jgi:hypothetical protein
MSPEIQQGLIPDPERPEKDRHGRRIVYPEQSGRYEITENIKDINAGKAVLYEVYKQEFLAENLDKLNGELQLANKNQLAKTEDIGDIKSLPTLSPEKEERMRRMQEGRKDIYD